MTAPHRARTKRLLLAGAVPLFVLALLAEVPRRAGRLRLRDVGRIVRAVLAPVPGITTGSSHVSCHEGLLSSGCNANTRRDRATFQPVLLLRRCRLFLSTLIPIVPAHPSAAPPRNRSALRLRFATDAGLHAPRECDCDRVGPALLSRLSLLGPRHRRRPSGERARWRRVTSSTVSLRSIRLVAPLAEQKSMP